MIGSTQREEEMFAAALALPAAERCAFLDRTLGPATDESLRRRVDDLLRAYGQSDDLEEPFQPVQQEAWSARAGVGAVAVDHLVGARIGHFHLRERIGEGGCGVVYLAEQAEPVRRRVALKVIKAGMDTAAVIARFEAERQALALMDHPHIARVFEGGATENGRPYFVMEFVQGVPITCYCDQAKLEVADRLKLFLKVCDAVQHAHQKGVIHRDLKPSNILVVLNDGVATPKVIDFGIAKAIADVRLTDRTLLTRVNDFIGTPVYMSPEQAVMLAVDVDTRSDIYSLGVLLYELLTAHLPFDRARLERIGQDEARRILREVDPPRPSACIAALADEERKAVARHRGIEPTKLGAVLRADLDWIVLRCLEKDRARRYETVSGLAKDIQRHLDEEPVLARPPGAAYRLRKWIRRHRVAVAAGTAVFATLLFGLTISVRQAIRATRAEAEQSRLRAQAVHEQQLANAARTHAENLLGYLLDDFFDELHPMGRAEVVGRFAHRLISYYDDLPAGLRTDDTERSRALAKLREGGALMRGKHLTEAAALLQEAQEFFEQRHAARPDDETAALDLATALGWNYAFGHLAANTQIPVERIIAHFFRAADLARPYAMRPNASIRARRVYAVALSELGPMPGREEELIGQSREARAIFRELGALDLHDLSLAICYCATTDTMAQTFLTLGRLAEAEQLENECDELIGRMIEKRPGDLEVLAMRWGLALTQSQIAERRFHLLQATEFAEAAVRRGNEYARFDREGVGAIIGPLFSRLRLSDLYWRMGRVDDSLRVSYETIAQIDAFPLARDWTLPERSFWQLQGDMSRELDRGNLAAAQRCVAGFMKAADKLRQLNCGWEPYLEEYSRTSARQVEYSLPRDHARTFADALEDLKRLAAIPALRPGMEGYRQGLRTRAVWTALGSGELAGRHAEVEALARRELPALREADFIVDQVQMEPRLWFALALNRQHKFSESTEVLRPVLVFYRHAWTEGDRSMDTSRGFAFALYLQGQNEANDGEGPALRRAALDEATSVLAALSDEAKQLESCRMIIDWVGAERARP